MDLHIFNPEHDIALSYDVPHISVPHAAQELRMNLGFLPALWAADGDCVLVEDIKFALKSAAPFKKLMADVLFVEKKDLAELPIDGVKPWGWDKRIRAELLESGVDERILPVDKELQFVRTISDRCNTTNVLAELRRGIEGRTCGEAFRCNSIGEVEDVCAAHRSVVVKCPWSSSGRGLRYVDGKMDDAKRAWVEKSIMRQGHVMVEPHYNKVCDFAVEFVSDGKGRVESRGLSVFHTSNGKYTGNVIASEEEKRMRISRYVDLELLDRVVDRIEKLFSDMLGSEYKGPFGVDMMAVADVVTGRLLLHPCVEMNMRRTMGHVALALTQKPLQFASMMSITHKVNYQFRIERIEGKFVNVIFR
ncbi:hypothetical protein [Prevotella sp.]|uniref:hypothetical protein n=1 Tax=Prevotella sp. TaxID=59823 RepID=UPI00307C4640